MIQVRLAALVAAAVLLVSGCSLVPAAGELGPVSASNHSGQNVVIKLATKTGSWTVAPGQRVTMLASRTAQVNQAYLVSATTCETLDTTDLQAIGNVHLTIGVGPTFTSVEGVDQPDIAPEIRPPSSICPD
jgi:hypothetical protein